MADQGNCDWIDGIALLVLLVVESLEQHLLEVRLGEDEGRVGFGFLFYFDLGFLGIGGGIALDSWGLGRLLFVLKGDEDEDREHGKEYEQIVHLLFHLELLQLDSQVLVNKVVGDAF